MKYYGTSNVLSGTWKDYDEDTLEYVENKVKKTDITFPKGRILLTTGATERNQKQNIYDLAGNLWEWTLATYHMCSVVGGSYRNDGSSAPAFCRINAASDISGDNLGFRVTLY